MVQAIPAGHEGVIPHLVVSDAQEAIKFYQKAFGAQEICRSLAPNGKILHAELRISNRPMFICDDFPEFADGKSRHPHALGNTPVTIHQYVEDCDDATRQATDAGATLTMPPMDMFWGDRFASVTDPFGHSWSLATHIKDLTPEEVAKAAAAAFDVPPTEGSGC